MKICLLNQILTGEIGFNNFKTYKNYIFTSQRNGIIYKIEKNGKIIKTIQVDNTYPADISDLEINENKIYLTTRSGKFIILKDEEKLLEIKIKPSISKPTIFKNYIYISTLSGWVYKLNLEGKVLDSLFIGGPIWTSPIIFNNYLIFTNSSGIFLINENETKQIEISPFDGNIFSQPIIYNNKLFILTEKGKIYCYDQNFKKCFEHQVIINDRKPRILSNFKIEEDDIYLIDKEGNFIKVSLKENKILCHKKLEGFFHYSNAILSINNYLITSSLEGDIYLISKNCEIINKVKISQMVGSISVYDDKIYINSEGFINIAGLCGF
jgi:outer membrane protein assembly factor BamB